MSNGEMAMTMTISDYDDDEILEELKYRELGAAIGLEREDAFEIIQMIDAAKPLIGSRMHFVREKMINFIS
jgi:hypothetical protein